MTDMEAGLAERETLRQAQDDGIDAQDDGIDAQDDGIDAQDDGSDARDDGWGYSVLAGKSA
jgi:hypothetical protein